MNPDFKENTNFEKKETNKLPDYINDLITKLSDVKYHFPNSYQEMVDKYFRAIENENTYRDFIKMQALIREKIVARIKEKEIRQLVYQKMNDFLVRYRKNQPEIKIKKDIYIDSSKIHDAHIEK